MNKHISGNLLLVSNFPSDTSYAWWLMEHFWVSFAEYFTKFDCHVYLAYPHVTSVSDSIKTAPIDVIELTIPWTTKEQGEDAKRFIKENDIFFVYFTDQPYFNLQYAQMRFNGIRQIFVHDHTPGDRPPIHGLKGILKVIKNKLPWLTADKMLCVSEHMKTRNILNGRIPANKCLVVQNGIDPINCRNNNRETRATLDVGINSILVTTTGRAHPYKRFDFIIEVAKALKTQAPELDVVFLLIGDGPAMHELVKLVSSLKIEKTVRLLGYRNDVVDILCTSDIALHAALGEGFSLSIIEYMSAGLPVLVPDIASVSQAITQNKTGLIFDKDDPNSAASYIAFLAKNDTLRHAMGAAAKIEANNTYTLEQCTQGLIQAVKSAY